MQQQQVVVVLEEKQRRLAAMSVVYHYLWYSLGWQVPWLFNGPVPSNSSNATSKCGSVIELRLVWFVAPPMQSTYILVADVDQSKYMYARQTAILYGIFAETG